MRFFWACLVVFTHSVFGLESILDHLDCRLSHIKPKASYIDAAFLVRLNHSENTESLKQEFASYSLPLTEYNCFAQLPDKTLKQYCSSVISPFLLTQTLSHLSIYKYSLSKGLGKVLVVENQAKIVADPHKMKEFIDHLEASHTPWDLIYTDVDYHTPGTGEYVMPCLGTNKMNKQVFSLALSKVVARYGTTGYIISASGMKKILDYFSAKWDDLPYDQTLFSIPNLQIYGSNIDLITNQYSSRIALDRISQPPPNLPYETGNTFWVDPRLLLTFDRFDVTAKYIYAKYHLNDYKTNWHINLYKTLLEKWVHFYNTEPLKVGFDAFESAFISLIDNLRKTTFNPKFPLVINNLGLANDGSHRIASCLALDLPIKAKVESGKSSPKMSAATFRQNYQLEEKYLDHMAFEYAKLKNNTYIVSLFPVAYPHLSEVEELLNEKGQIVYSKEIWLTKSGQAEYIRAVHAGQWEITSSNDDYRQSREYAQLAFPSTQNYPLRVYLYEAPSPTAIANINLELLTLCQKGEEAIHINKFHKDTIKLATTVFNKNSIDFINKRNQKSFEKFDFLFMKLQSFIAEHGLDPELLCVDTGSVLSAFGLRDCNDMDILHWTPLPSSFKKYQIDSHNAHLHHHSTSLDEILFNPDCHFYYNGIKFVAPHLVKKMKADRGAEKDLRDIKLLDSLEPPIAI